MPCPLSGFIQDVEQKMTEPIWEIYSLCHSLIITSRLLHSVYVYTYVPGGRDGKGERFTFHSLPDGDLTFMQMDSVWAWAVLQTQTLSHTHAMLVDSGTSIYFCIYFLVSSPAKQSLDWIRKNAILSQWLHIADSCDSVAQKQMLYMCVYVSMCVNQWEEEGKRERDKNISYTDEDKLKERSD